MNRRETHVHHAWGCLDWQEGSGLQGARPRPLAAFTFETRLEEPADMRVVARPSHGLLWRDPGPANAASGGSPLHPVFHHAPRAADLLPPDLPALTVAGTVHEREGRFLPRCFRVTLSLGERRALRLFRHPVAVHVGAGGSLSGHLRYQDGQPAPWSLLMLTVALPPTTETLVFHAQADRNGDFLIPLQGLPLARPAAAGGPLQATLDVHCDLSLHADALPDPDADAFRPVAVGSPADGQFRQPLPLSIMPGNHVRLTTHGRDHLVLRPPP